MASRTLLLAGAALAALALTACLAPITAVQYADVVPTEEAESGYRVDPVDDALVYSREGLQVRVRYLSDGDLLEEMPGSDNPYVIDEISRRLGYRQKLFTVFEVTLVNPTFAKVRLDPEKATLVTGHGERLDSYAINRTEAAGGTLNFEAFFLSRGVQTGNEQKLYLERMGKIRETIYHRDSPVFKGNSYTGKVVFGLLPPDTERVELILYDVVTGFGIDDEPTERVTLRFPFEVEQGIRDRVETE